MSCNCCGNSGSYNGISRGQIWGTVTEYMPVTVRYSFYPGDVTGNGFVGNGNTAFLNNGCSCSRNFYG